MEIELLVKLCVTALEDTKAVDIKILNVTHLTDIADYMIICSGTSSRHTKSLGDKLMETVKEKGVKILGQEDDEANDWVLVDLSDVIIHIMLPQTRQFYDLESLWEYDASDTEQKKS